MTVAADTTPPEVESVTVPISGSEVELVFDEDLDELAGDNPARQRLLSHRCRASRHDP